MIDHMQCGHPHVQERGLDSVVASKWPCSRYSILDFEENKLCTDPETCPCDPIPSENEDDFCTDPETCPCHPVLDFDEDMC